LIMNCSLKRAVPYHGPLSKLPVKRADRKEVLQFQQTQCSDAVYNCSAWYIDAKGTRNKCRIATVDNTVRLRSDLRGMQ
jgi:hypothetical protein